MFIKRHFGLQKTLNSGNWASDCVMQKTCNKNLQLVHLCLQRSSEFLSILQGFVDWSVPEVKYTTYIFKKQKKRVQNQFYIKNKTLVQTFEYLLNFFPKHSWYMGIIFRTSTSAYSAKEGHAFTGRGSNLADFATVKDKLLLKQASNLPHYKWGEKTTTSRYFSGAPYSSLHVLVLPSGCNF